MKKFILVSAAVMALAGAANAELRPLTPSKPFDNYSLTVKGGVVTPLIGTNGNSFWENMRGEAGLEVQKQIAPAFGIGVEGEMWFNTSRWNSYRSLHNDIDNIYVGAFGAINFNNLFAGYAGHRRVCEVEGVLGLGWLHGFAPKSQGHDYDVLAGKAGVNINFNFGSDREWTFSLKPAVIWGLTPGNDPVFDKVGHHVFSQDNAVFELQAGFTYHFACSNGTHGYTFEQPCDYTPYNEQINALRAENAALIAANADVVAANTALAAQLDECLNRPTPVVTNTVVQNTNTLESVRYVYYRIGSSVIAADQRPNVEMIADYMKHNPKSTVEIKGYASQDGNLDFNLKLAAKRAQAVKTMLVDKYGIKADRIKAEGQGIGHMFKEESWNRVAICILNEGE